MPSLPSLLEGRDPKVGPTIRRMLQFRFISPFFLEIFSTLSSHESIFGLTRRPLQMDSIVVVVP